MKLFLTILLVGAVLANQPQGVFTEDIEQQLKESHLGRVFLRLVSLKSKAQQFDFSKLFNALDDLENSIKERKDDEIADYKKDEIQYYSDLDFYNGQITQFENEIATHTIDITDFTDARDAMQKTFQDKSDELKGVTGLRDKLAADMAKEETTFKDQQSQYGNAISALDQALELVGTLRDGSFIQNGEKHVVMLEKSLSELKHRRVMYGPLVAALTQMLQPSFNDQEASAKVLKLLQNLRDSIVKSKQQLESNYQTEREADEKNLSDYNRRIEILKDVVIPTIQGEIQTKDQQISTKKGLLNDAQNNLASAKNNLEVTQTRWVERSNENSKLLDQYSQQLALMPKVINVLEGSGIRRR